MSVLMSSRSMKEVKVSPVLLVLLFGAICGDIVSAARLLPEDHDFSLSDMTVNPAAFDLNLNSVVDGSGSQRPKLHSEVARSGSPCDGTENMLDANDIARPGGLNTINAGTAEISFKGKDTYTRPRLSSSSGHKKNAEGLVFNVLPEGPITPSGPGRKGHATVTERRLSTSEHSPGVGHTQKGSKRILGSVPSPGVGN